MPDEAVGTHEKSVGENKTYQEVIREGESYLEKKGVPDPHEDAWQLMSCATGMKRGEWLLKRREKADEEELQKFLLLIKKRGERIPLQHLLGETVFMGLAVRVDENVLIPRQDTELLAERVLRDQKAGKVPEKASLLDMCTGSGCLAIALKVLGDFQRVDAADLSEKALETAKENARLHKADIRFIKSDLFDAFAGEKYDVIAANPPYIPTAVIDELEAEVKDHDPHMALDGHEDGLYFYRQLAEKCPQYLTEGGRVYFEIGYDQGEAVRQMLLDRGFLEVTVLKDYGGNDRVVQGIFSYCSCGVPAG